MILNEPDPSQAPNLHWLGSRGNSAARVMGAALQPSLSCRALFCAYADGGAREQGHPH
jgi:hypothetical protein